MSLNDSVYYCEIPDVKDRLELLSWVKEEGVYFRSSTRYSREQQDAKWVTRAIFMINRDGRSAFWYSAASGYPCEEVSLEELYSIIKLSLL